MLYTEDMVRQNLRNREGKRVFYLGKGDTLTPGARDWLKGQRIEILDAALAKPERFCLVGGGYAEEKPEYMTHLNAQYLVPKTHPRIRFRGAVDTLEAELILAAQQTQGEIKAGVGQVLELARRLIRCDVLEEPVGEITLCGLTEQQQRRQSHRPQDFYGQPHFMPEPEDGPAIAALNRARCAARAAELQGVDTFSDRDGCPTRPDIVQALNRMSSMLYILMIREKARQSRK